MRRGKDQNQKKKSKGCISEYPFLIGWTFCVIFFAYGCSNSIGDACIADSQCGTSQTCDIRSPEGYCTIADCEEETCPGGSICVEFKNAQTYCMATCVQSEDCRDGYRCVKIEDEVLGETIGYCGQ